MKTQIIDLKDMVVLKEYDYFIPMQVGNMVSVNKHGCEVEMVHLDCDLGIYQIIIKGY